jgi:serine/threonine-protein kinase
MVSSGVLLSGRYRLDERIASGGMGDVWRGTDEVLGRVVAIKVMQAALLEERGFVERFRAEARTMATVNHPGVVQIYDFGHDQVAYLVMEFIEGEPLSSTLNRVGRLTPERTMSLVAQAAEALHASHLKGVVHRDVKPGNLLVRPNGTLVLTDYGIARTAAAAQLTATGAILGTASYISPEQASGVPASPASDVYSLGVVAYQCLSGYRPFEGNTPFEIAMMHVNQIARALPDDVPVAVRQVVERAMAKEPGARWATASDFAQAARKAATQPTLPLPDPKAVPFQRGSAPVPPRVPQTVVYQQPAQTPVRPKPVPAPDGRNPLVVLWVVLAMLVVLICTAYAGYQANKNRGTGSLPLPQDVLVAMTHQTEGRR